jgi:Flp pilus assembly protein TadB
LDPAVRIDAVGCETGFPVDDVGVALTGGGFILAQAKRGMRRLDTQAADLRSALDQLVHAMIQGLTVNHVAMRPVDETRDRLVIRHEPRRQLVIRGARESLRASPGAAAIGGCAYRSGE